MLLIVSSDENVNPAQSKGGVVYLATSPVVPTKLVSQDGCLINRFIL